MLVLVTKLGCLLLLAGGLVYQELVHLALYFDVNRFWGY